MELLLIRHGLPLRVELVEGPADPTLSPDGVAQANALAAFIGTTVDGICSSPLRRALETAAPLAAATGLEIEVVDGIAEMDRDMSWYVPLEELRDADDPRWEQVMAYWTSDEAVEQRTEFATGVVEAVEQIVAAHQSERIAVVCHGGVINAYLAHVLGIGGSAFFEPAYTSISRVLAHSDGRRQLGSANETPHLPR